MSRRLFLPGEQGSSGAAVQLAVYRNYLNLLKKKKIYDIKKTNRNSTKLMNGWKYLPCHLFCLNWTVSTSNTGSTYRHIAGMEERRKENSTSPAIHKTDWNNTDPNRLKQHRPKTNNKTEATWTSLSTHSPHFLFVLDKKTKSFSREAHRFV